METRNSEESTAASSIAYLYFPRVADIVQCNSLNYYLPLIMKTAEHHEYNYNYTETFINIATFLRLVAACLLFTGGVHMFAWF